MATSNASLSVSSVNLHVVLRLTLLPCVLLASWVFLGERPSLLSLLASALVLAGAAMAAWRPSSSFVAPQDAAPAILLALASVLCQAAMFVATRAASRNGDASWRRAVRLAAAKMAAAALLLLPVAAGVDPGGWMRLADASSLLLFAGVWVTGLFQGLLVASQHFALPSSTALLSVLAPVLQLSISLPPHSSLSPLQIAGFAAAAAGALLYAAARLLLLRAQRLSKEAPALLVNTDHHEK